MEHHGDSLFSYAMSKLRDRDVAEEVVQETFLAALRNLDQFRNTGSEGAWLMGILKRKVIDHVRLLARRPVNLDGDDTVVGALFDADGKWSEAGKQNGGLTLDSIEQEEFKAILGQCLEKLPYKQATAFVMREMQQDSGEQVCKELGVSSSNLWVLMHRARIRLAECIKARWAMGDS